MSLLLSVEEIKREVVIGKSRKEYTRESIERNRCPLCGNKLRENARWLFCYRPSKHDMFRASKEKYGKAIDHSVPWENGNQMETKIKPRGNHKATNSFKANVPKKLRQEWGQRMNHLRHIV